MVEPVETTFDICGHFDRLNDRIFISMKKTILSIITTILLTASAFTLPGFTSFIPDSAGEYVYYRDSSFTRESYIGILGYDAATIQIRYFAPQDDQAMLPAKEIAILVTVDPKADFWNMTGERIISTILPDTDDTDIVNYLHDLLYEFSARRISQVSVESGKVIVDQDYAQFGGKVAITFDARIPLFNIRTITDDKGSKVFDCVSIGTIKSSEDKTFEAFKGVTAPKPVVTKETRKATKAKVCKFESRKVTLDEDWEQKMENFWTLGNDSLITMSILPKVAENKVLNDLYVERKLLESTEGSYTDFQNCEISYTQAKDSYKIVSTSYFPESNINVCLTKLLTRNKEGGFDYFSISTYQTAYLKNPLYFDKIVKSYR